MAFREQIAWLTLGSMMIAYTLYFTLLIGMTQSGPPPVLSMLALFGGITIAQVIVIVIITSILAIRQHREANGKADERDRAISRRGSHIAYYVLMMGMILVGVIMPFSDPAWKITNTALLALVIAEAVRLGVIVYSYRKGWHG